MALPVAVRPGEHFDGANRIYPHFRRFPQANTRTQRANRRRWRNATRFNKRGDADAAQFAVFGGLLLALAKVFIIGELQRLLHRGIIITGVVAHDHRSLVRELGHKIAAAELRRIKPKLARGNFHQALDHKCCFWPPCAAIGVHRSGVGVNRIHLCIDIRNIILARQQRCVQIGRHRGRERGEIGTQIGDGMHPYTNHLALVVHRQFGMGNMVAPVGIRKEGLGAVRCPLHRAANFFRCPCNDDLFGIDKNL